MDEQQTRKCVQDHADAVVRGDFDHVTEDFRPDLRPQVPQIGASLPQPVTSAEVRSLEVGDDESVAEIHYAGDSGSVTIRSHWQEIDGRPMIVAGEPIS
jgi:hypothetical protein